MVNLTLKVIDIEGTVIDANQAADEVSLVYCKEYKEGDRLVFESDQKDIYLILQYDDAMGPAFIYLTKEHTEFIIPFGEKRRPYSPKAFYGERHLLLARAASLEEIKAYRNLACNVNDQHGDTGAYPHAVANVETRGESIFAARNAIDGVRENHSHGSWPYHSWGINMQDDAEMKVEFGRMVEADKIIMYTRADFPHDNWWESVTLTFSDGSEIVWDIEKSDKAHVLTFDKKNIEWVLIHKLIKSNHPSPYPALSQLEVYGRNLN